MHTENMCALNDSTSFDFMFYLLILLLAQERFVSYQIL